MSDIKKYLLLGLLTVFMLASSGIAVGRHICHSRGVVEFSLTGTFSCCGYDKKLSANDCCRKHTQYKKTRCCDDELVYALMDIVKKNEERKEYRVFLSAVAVVVCAIRQDLNYQNNKTFSYISPPFRSIAGTVNQLLSLLGIFRI